MSIEGKGISCAKTESLDIEGGFARVAHVDISIELRIYHINLGIIFSLQIIPITLLSNIADLDKIRFLFVAIAAPILGKIIVPLGAGIHFCFCATSIET